MVKAFIISFGFKGRSYLAMVTDFDPYKASYTVKLYNESLFRIIPGGELVCSEHDLSMLPPYKHPLAKALLHTIHESVDTHLKCSKQYSTNRLN